MTGTAEVIHGNALNLPLDDNTVDLVITSPPYFGLRSYTDQGTHYTGQLGSEATPAEFVDALIAATREMMRVVKPSGSIFINLGDAYSKGVRLDETALTLEDAAWLGGVIDSDGSISVHKQGTSYTAWVRVGQMRSEVVQRIHKLTGTGSVCQDARGVWNWQAAAQQASALLRQVWPWLHIKRNCALAAVELQDRKTKVAGKGRWNALTDDEMRHRERIREAVLAWNRGDSDDYQPPLLPVPNLDRATWVQQKSLIGVPWRYAIACIDQLGLILRAEIIWSKPNGLPESVTDRVRRSHETWFHFTLSPRYYSAVDEIREPHEHDRRDNWDRRPDRMNGIRPTGHVDARMGNNSLGKLPGSVWVIPTQPLTVPPDLGVDHFAAYPTEWPKRIIQGWSPESSCLACGFLLGSSYDNGMLGVRRADNSRAHLVRARSEASTQEQPVLQQGLLQSKHCTEPEVHEVPPPNHAGLRGGLESGSPDGTEVGLHDGASASHGGTSGPQPPAIGSRPPQERDQDGQPDRESGTVGEDRARPTPQARTEAVRMSSLRRHDPNVRHPLACPNCGGTSLTPGLILDPFGGTGTSALVAKALGRHGISVDLSEDYCRLAEWRTQDRNQLAHVLDYDRMPAPDPDQLDLFGEVTA